MNIVGHEREFLRLKGMIFKNTLPHAMLFTGTLGTGKKEIAKELSRIILCHNEGAEDCSCPSCKAFREGSHPDFHLLAPTANGKSSPMIRIDELGELLQKLSRLPLLSKSRVALIDDADFMNEPAANRLLKTLEEPVGDIKFFLVASRRSKILPTILSRTMPVSFFPLSEETVTKLLMQRGIGEETAKEAARLSFGSMKKALDLTEGDSLKIMEECAAFLRESLSCKKILDMAEAMGKEDKEAAREFFLALMLILRDLTLYHEGAALSFNYGANLIEKYNPLLCLRLLALTQEYEKRLSANINLRLCIEGFLFKFKNLSGGI